MTSTHLLSINKIEIAHSISIAIFLSTILWVVYLRELHSCQQQQQQDNVLSMYSILHYHQSVSHEYSILIHLVESRL